MAKKPTLTNINAGFASNTVYNDNNTAIRDAFDNTLSRDGSTPNSMSADLDMNGRNILNVGNIDDSADLTLTNVKSFGAVGDGSTDDTQAIQDAWDAVFASGGELYFPAGKYKITSKLYFDVRSVAGAPPSDPKRVNIRGAGKGNTIILPSTDNQIAMHIQGDGTVAAHAYFTISDIAFGGNTPTSRTAEGLRLEDLAFLDLVGVSFHNLDVCLNLIGTLSSSFNNLAFNESKIGVNSKKGVRDSNANYWSGCEFRELTLLAYNGFDGMVLPVFSGCQFEGCGTHGAADNGALHFRMSQAIAEAGPSLTGCFFEGNGGDYDVYFEEAASGDTRVSVNVSGCLFQRNSNSKFVTNNRKTTGSVDINIAGSAFTNLGTYTADASRPHLNFGTLGRFRDHGNRYEDAVEGPTISQGLPYAGFVKGSDGASVTGTLPINWTVSQANTGVMQVTHSLGHSDYSVVATTASGLARIVQRCIIANDNFRVVTTNLSDTHTDADFSFMLVELKPVE